MSRGRREVRRSLTTLLVLGSITVRLLVFSLLTKTRPVSLAHAARDSAADSTTTNATIANAEMLSGAGDRRGVGTGDPSPACESDWSQRTTERSGRASTHAGRTAGIFP